MIFVDENGNALSQEQKEAMDYTEGRFLQDDHDPSLYVWSPWATVEPREEEHIPETSQLDMVEAQAMYTALMTDTLLPEEEE